MKRWLLLLLLLLFVLASTFAFAQGQPGRPSRGGSSAAPSPTGGPIGQYVGPSRRCYQTRFYSDRQMTNAAVTYIWQPVASSGLNPDVSFARTTADRFAYTPRAPCSVGSSANSLCTITSGQLLAVHGFMPYSMWFRWAFALPTASSTAYVGAIARPVSGATSDVSCSIYTGVVKSNAVYARCNNGLSVMQVCTNDADATPTCKDTLFTCSPGGVYDVTFTFTPPSTVAWRIQDMSTGLLYETTQTTDLPTVNTPLGFASSVCSGTNGGFPFNSLAYLCVTTE